MYLTFTIITFGLWALWAALLWWSLLFEKRRPLTLAPLGDEDPRENNAYVLSIRREAEAAGFFRMGIFTDDDPRWRQGVFTMMMRPDGLTLLRIHHSALVRKVVLLSALTSDVWVVTASSIADPDSSGLSEEELVYTPTSFEPVWRRHIERTLAREPEIIPWSPEEIASDLQSRDRRRVERLIADKMARVRDPLTGTWSFTVAGAIRQRALNKKFMREMMMSAKSIRKKQ